MTGPAEEYRRHLAEKEARVRSLLAAHGVGVELAGIRASPMEEGYRAHAKLVSWPGAALLGVDPRRGRVPWEEMLWTLPEEGRAIVAAAAGVLARHGPGCGATGFDLRLEHGARRGHLRLAVRRDHAGPVEPLCRELMEEAPHLLGVSAPSQGVEVGETLLRNRLLGRTVLAHPLAFFQTHLQLTPELAAEVRAAAEGASTLVDLYCGVGLHSVLAAEPGSRVVGVDSHRLAVESARRNAALHGLEGAEYRDRPVERFVEEARCEAPEVVFVNPSRWGCAPGVPEAVAEWRPGRVVLVSCSIESHLRDTLAFAAAGYHPASLRCFDLFPFSDFLESVSVLEPE